MNELNGGWVREGQLQITDTDTDTGTGSGKLKRVRSTERITTILAHLKIFASLFPAQAQFVVEECMVEIVVIFVVSERDKFFVGPKKQSREG
jgi:hypothetical protein